MNFFNHTSRFFDKLKDTAGDHFNKIVDDVFGHPGPRKMPPGQQRLLKRKNKFNNPDGK